VKINACFDFTICTRSVWNVFHSKKNLRKYYHERTDIFLESVRYFCYIWMKLNFLNIFFENNCSSTKFIEPICSMRTVWRTDERKGLTWLMNIIFAWPCMIDINNIDNQLDATIKVYKQFQSAQDVSGNYFAHLQEQ